MSSHLANRGELTTLPPRKLLQSSHTRVHAIDHRRDIYHLYVVVHGQVGDGVVIRDPHSRVLRKNDTCTQEHEGHSGPLLLSQGLVEEHLLRSSLNCSIISSKTTQSSKPCKAPACQSPVDSRSSSLSYLQRSSLGHRRAPRRGRRRPSARICPRCDTGST